MINYIADRQKFFYTFLGTILFVPIIIHFLFSSLNFSERIVNSVLSLFCFGLFYIFLKLLLLLYQNTYFKGDLRMQKWIKLTAEFFVFVPLAALLIGIWIQIEYFGSPERTIEIGNYGMIGVILAAYNHWCKNYKSITFYFS